jgi:membrane-associated phospholipid phosphatase
VQRVSSPVPRLLRRFVARHRWSLPLSLGSAAFFAHWAEEMRELELKPFDAAVATTIAAARGHVDSVMLALTRFGEGESLFAVLALAALTMVWRRRQREAVFLTAVGAGTLLLNAGLKLAFARARPDADSLYMIHTPRSYSFPSGHALGTTAVVFGLVVVARVAGLRGVWLALVAAIGALVVLGVSTSRVYFGVHFPSDVIGGMLAGAAWVSAMAGWFYPRVLPGEEVPPAKPTPPAEAS